jgi:sucrose-6-phosphate hydrolase SacC (GH32 family)
MALRAALCCSAMLLTAAPLPEDAASDDSDQLQPAVARAIPDDPFLQPTFHLVLRNHSQLIHQQDASGNLFLDGVWHWFIDCTDGGQSLIWCHLLSEDLRNWRWAASPLVTGQGGDTGSIAVTSEGIYLFVPGCGGICRRVALDRTLNSWGPTSAAISSPHPRNFRDPARPFRGADGHWYIIVGSGLTAGETCALTPNVTGPVAQALMYRASDATLAHWEFVSALWSARTTVRGVSVDTFECPDIWPLDEDGTVVFEGSMCSDTCEPPLCGPTPVFGRWNGHSEEYWVGKVNATANSLEVSSHGVFDYGNYYCSKTAAGEHQVGSRRVLFGWIHPLTNNRGNGTDEWQANVTGWGQSPEALPREVTGPEADGELRFAPVQELEALRDARSSTNVSETLRCGDRIPIMAGHQLELRATFSWSGVTLLQQAVRNRLFCAISY